MQDSSIFAIEARQIGGKVVTFGIIAIVVILAGAGIVLLLTLPDANAFNARVEDIFVQNDDLTKQAELKLLEILAQSGTAFAAILPAIGW